MSPRNLQATAKQVTIRISADALRSLLERIFLAAGLNAENARITSVGVLEADLRGHLIQGTDHIYSTVRDIKEGRINGHAKPRVLRESAATAQIDGDGATGHVAGMFATEVAIKKATVSGAAIVGLVRAGDVFMLGAYVDCIARAGMTGIAFTNSMPRVHPHGGIDPILGTNPCSFGFPVKDSDPVIVDTTTSASAIGHARIASYDGTAIAEGIAIDKAGRPTTDPVQALDGALAPLGGAKGFALGLAVALLSGPTIGGLLGSDLVRSVLSNEAPKRSHLFIAIDANAFGDAALAQNRTHRYLDDIRSSRKAPGVTEILIPGQRSIRSRRQSLAHGITLPETVWKRTVEIARDLGVSDQDIPIPSSG